jgi:hypothetical protein
VQFCIHSVEECVSSLRRKVSPDHVLTCNCSNSTSPPGARNETALPEGLVCISGALLPLLACLSIVGLGTIAVLTVVGVYFLVKHCSGKASICAHVVFVFSEGYFLLLQYNDMYILHVQ